MTTRTDQPRPLSDDIIARIDAAIGCRQCGGSLDDSPSPDFCGEECQQTWHTARAEPLPVPISAPGWIELRDERTGEQMSLRELLPAATEVREVPTNASTGWIELGVIPEDALRALFGLPEPDVREIHVRQFTTDLGTVYEAVAEIAPRYGVPVIVAHQYATAHDVTPTAWLITTPTAMRIEFRDERTGHVLARNAVHTFEPDLD